MSYHVLRYIVLLFHSIYVSGAAQTMEGRVKALRRVRIFNMPLGVGSMLEGFKANDVKYESTQKHFWNWECSSPDWKVNLIQSRPMSLMLPDVPAFSSSFERFKIQGWWWWFGPSINVHRSLALFFWTWLIQVPGAAGCHRVSRLHSLLLQEPAVSCRLPSAHGWSRTLRRRTQLVDVVVLWYALLILDALYYCKLQ